MDNLTAASKSSSSSSLKRRSDGDDDDVFVKLLCNEENCLTDCEPTQEPRVLRPQMSNPDLVVLHNPVVIEKMLSGELRTIPRGYSDEQINEREGSASTNVFTLRKRRMVLNWIKDVIDELDLELSVFFGVVIYIDRIMTCGRQFMQTQFQLVASACLWVASKLFDTCMMSAGTLCHYTDNAYTVDQMSTMELIVLTSLEWDTSTLIPCDFWDITLCRIPSFSQYYKNAPLRRGVTRTAYESACT